MNLPTLILVLTTGAAGAAPPPEPWVAQLSQPVPPQGPPGKLVPWKNTVTPRSDGQVTPAQAAAWEVRLRAVADHLLARPVLQRPLGFFPQATGFVDALAMGPYEASPATGPLVGGVSIYAFDPMWVDAAGPVKLRPGAEAPMMSVEFNYTYAPAGFVWMKDARGSFGPLVIQGYHAGFPLILDSLVLTRDGRLPYAPVSQERALKAYVAYWEAESARANSPAWKATGLPNPAAPELPHVAQAKARLASMTAAERARPAWIHPQAGTGLPPHGLGPGLVEEGDGRALVEIDRDFFDPQKPRDTLRVAWVRGTTNEAFLYRLSSGSGGYANSAHAVATLFQQVDWRQFAETFLVAR